MKKFVWILIIIMAFPSFVLATNDITVVTNWDENKLTVSGKVANYDMKEVSLTILNNKNTLVYMTQSTTNATGSYNMDINFTNYPDGEYKIIVGANSLRSEENVNYVSVQPTPTPEPTPETLAITVTDSIVLLKGNVYTTINKYLGRPISVVVTKKDATITPSENIMEDITNIICYVGIFNRTGTAIECNFKFDDTKTTGYYTAYIMGEGIAQTIIKDFYYTGEADRMIVINALNSATSGTDFYNILVSYNNIFNFNLTFSQEYEKNVIVEAMREDVKQKAYVIVGDVRDSYNRSQQKLGALKTLNESTRNLISDILENNATLLGIDYTLYTSLAPIGRDYVNAAMSGKAFTSLESIKDAYGNAIDYATTLKDSTGQNNSTPPSGSGVTNISVTPNFVNAVKPGVSFSDLQDVHWAVESINNLVNKGVISGDGNGLFRPRDFVKREELIKMIVVGYKALDTSVTTDFLDVPLSSWAYSYIATAQKSGILNGYDGKFGIGDNITRQDIVTLAYRMALRNGVDFSKYSSSDVFEDEEEISYYAKAAVMAIKNAKIISGRENNLFAPKEFCTRAEVAKIIDGLLQLK